MYSGESPQERNSALSDELTIRLMFATDLQRGFLATVASLKPCNLTNEQAVEVFRRRMRQKIQTYVALLEGRVVGTASLIIEPKFINTGGVVGHIEDVAIHQAYQRRGIGDRLMRHLLDVCRDQHCYKVILDCDPSLFSYYEKFGFHRWAESMRLDF